MDDRKFKVSEIRYVGDQQLPALSKADGSVSIRSFGRMSLKDCSARVIPFTTTEGACSVSFSCASPLSTPHPSTGSPAAADQAQIRLALCPASRTSMAG